MKLAGVLCLYDFVGWSTWPARFEKTKAGLEAAGLDTFSVEVGMSSEPRTSADEYVQATAANIVWQKERLWNRTAEAIPATYDALAFCDADVLFSARDWVDQVERLLERFEVLQPFRTDGAGRPNCIEASTGKGIGRTGLAWCMRREYFERIGGWYDRAGCCWGDMIYAAGLLDRFDWISAWLSPAAYGPTWRYCRSLRDTRATYVDQVVRHQPHATTGGRAYNEQCWPLIRANFDPAADLVDDGRGLLAWSTDDPYLPISASRYFYGRNDDDTGKKTR